MVNLLEHMVAVAREVHNKMGVEGVSTGGTTFRGKPAVEVRALTPLSITLTPREVPIIVRLVKPKAKREAKQSRQKKQKR
jgi:hypothetical protein